MGFLTEMLVCEDMTSCTDLACRCVVDQTVHCATALHSNSYYTVVAGIFLASAASYKNNMWSSISQNLRLFSAILVKWLLMPHVLICTHAYLHMHG